MLCISQSWPLLNLMQIKLKIKLQEKLFEMIKMVHLQTENTNANSN